MKLYIFSVLLIEYVVIRCVWLIGLGVVVIEVGNGVCRVVLFMWIFIWGIGERVFVNFWVFVVFC